MRQGDLFGREPAQRELFAAAEPAAEAVAVTPERVRAKLRSALDLMRSAERMPWPERTARINQAIFPQMADWLPNDEADQFRFAFAEEFERLLAA